MLTTCSCNFGGTDISHRLFPSEVDKNQTFLLSNVKIHHKLGTTNWENLPFSRQFNSGIPKEWQWSFYLSNSRRGPLLFGLQQRSLWAGLIPDHLQLPPWTGERHHLQLPRQVLILLIEISRGSISLPPLFFSFFVLSLFSGGAQDPGRHEPQDVPTQSKEAMLGMHQTYSFRRPLRMLRPTNPSEVQKEKEYLSPLIIFSQVLVTSGSCNLAFLWSYYFCNQLSFLPSSNTPSLFSRDACVLPWSSPANRRRVESSGQLQCALSTRDSLGERLTFSW